MPFLKKSLYWKVIIIKKLLDSSVKAEKADLPKFPSSPSNE